jgi:hypothetical protein
MADIKIKSLKLGKPIDLKGEPGKFGPSPLASERNVKRIDEMTLDDYRRGVRKVLDGSRLSL